MTLSRRFLFGAAVAAPAALADRVLAAPVAPAASVKPLASLEITVDTESLRAVVRDEAQRVLQIVRTYNREYLWGPTRMRSDYRA